MQDLEHLKQLVTMFLVKMFQINQTCQTKSWSVNSSSFVVLALCMYPFYVNGVIQAQIGL